LAFNQMLASFILFLRSHLAGLHLFKSDSFMSVADKVLMILICGSLLFLPILSREFTIMDFALAQLVSYLGTAVAGFIMVLQKARIFRWQLNFRGFTANLGKSFPYALLILLMALYTRVDSIMLEQLQGAFETGVYMKAFRLLDAVNQFSYLIGALLLSIFAKMLAERQDVSRISQLSFGIIVVATVAVSLATAFYAQPLLSALYNDNAELSTPVYKLLIFSSIAFGSTYVFGTLLTARGNLRSLNWVALAGFVINILLNFWLIPIYGPTGAAAATLLTQISTGAVQIWLSFKIVRVRFVRYYSLRMLLFASLSLLIAYLLNLVNGPWYWLSLATFISILIISLPLRIFNLQAAIELVKTRLKAG